MENAEQVFFMALEIGDQDLDDQTGIAAFHGLDGLREDLRAAVGEVVPIDGGNHHVFEIEFSQGLGDAQGLVPIGHRRPARLHGAETAGAGAGVTQDHDGGAALGPTLADVGAHRLLAHRVKPSRAHETLQLEEVLAGGNLCLKPRGFHDSTTSKGKCSKKLFRASKNWIPSAPSKTRWSKERSRAAIRLGTMASSTTQGRE